MRSPQLSMSGPSFPCAPSSDVTASGNGPNKDSTEVSGGRYLQCSAATHADLQRVHTCEARTCSM